VYNRCFDTHYITRKSLGQRQVRISSISRLVIFALKAMLIITLFHSLDHEPIISLYRITYEDALNSSCVFQIESISFIICIHVYALECRYSIEYSLAYVVCHYISIHPEKLSMYNEVCITALLYYSIVYIYVICIMFHIY